MQRSLLFGAVAALLLIGPWGSPLQAQTTYGSPPDALSAPQPTRAPGAPPSYTGSLTQHTQQTLRQQQIDGLRRERAELSLGLPITLMAVGGGVLLNAGAFALVAAASCSNSLGGGCEDEHLYIMGGIAGVGGIVAVIGLTMLLDRISERRELGRLIRRIEQEPGASRSHLQLQPRLAGHSLLSWSL